MEFIEFKLPDQINKIPNAEYFISYIISDEKGFRLALCNNKEDFYDIVFDFGHAVVDYRVSQEGRRLDHHIKHFYKNWIFVEVINSDYLKKIYEESGGIYAETNPNLKHYISGDTNDVVDIIACEEPTVYKITRNFQRCF